MIENFHECDAVTDINDSDILLADTLHCTDCPDNIARAQGDAASFDKIYAEYKLAPEVTKRRLYYETMERVLRQNDKTVVETNGVQTYLPLPELKRRSQSANPPEAQ